MAARLWLVVLLALSLWPSAALASTAAPVDPPDRISDGRGDYGNHVFRVPAGLEVVGRFESGGLRAMRGSSHHRSQGGSGSAPYVLSGSGWTPAHARWLARPCVQAASDAAAPFCERFPYFATAPPSSR